jgi:hypothetical protein
LNKLAEERLHRDLDLLEVGLEFLHAVLLGQAELNDLASQRPIACAKQFVELLNGVLTDVTARGEVVSPLAVVDAVGLQEVNLSDREDVSELRIHNHAVADDVEHLLGGQTVGCTTGVEVATEGLADFDVGVTKVAPILPMVTWGGILPHAVAELTLQLTEEQRLLCWYGG